MAEQPGIILTLLSFLMVIGPLIFIHELGHYFVGRACGVKADAFSIGFGRPLLGYTDKRGTHWKLGWLPMGGYVKFAGDMNPASVPTPEWLALPPEERAQTFQAKKVWQRFLIVLAGPAANFLLAILIFMGFFWVLGRPMTPPMLAAVVAQSPADKAGLAPGDVIVKVQGRTVESFDDVADIIRLRPNERIDIEYRRKDEIRNVSLLTDVATERDRFGNEFRKGVIGIGSGPGATERLEVTELPGAAIKQTVAIVQMIIDTTGQIITGRRSITELGGPLKIAQTSGEQATLGWLNILLFMALISINLGFINLLPIPLLDGGHLIFYCAEALLGRPVPPVAQEWAFKAGLAILLSFMLFVTLNDVANIGVVKRLIGLIG